MAKLVSYFDDFLAEIRTTENQRNDCKTGHETLRKRLWEYQDLKPIILDTFLQGSYRRHTAVRPANDTRSDVDVIVVTNLDRNAFTPKQALAKFEPFLEKHYKGKWEPKGRAFGIKLSYVELDLVPTSAPAASETKALQEMARFDADESIVYNDAAPPATWLPQDSPALTLFEQLYGKAGDQWSKVEPLYIPDRDANEWDKTHPLAQIAATQAKNKITNKCFVNIVKAAKWWKLFNHPDVKHPKGYPLEHLVWLSCPNNSTTVADGLTRTLEDIASRYADDIAANRVPFIPDHGVPDHNVLGRLSIEEFKTFYTNVKAASPKAREALDCVDICESADLWRELLGEKFKRCPNRESKSSYTPRTEVGIVKEGRYA